MSFAEYLGLNEDSLRELEDAAAQRRALANETASSALGRAYQEASAGLEKGGTGNLTGTASYGDFLKAQRAAQQAAIVPGDFYEATARGVVAPQQAGPSMAMQRNAYQQRLDARRQDIATGRANVAAERARQQAERDAQARVFGVARNAFVSGVDREIAGMQPAMADAERRAAHLSPENSESAQNQAAGNRQAAQDELNNYYRPRLATLNAQKKNFGGM